MLLIETQKKKKAKSEWKESLNRSELLNIETVEDFAEVAKKIHIGDSPYKTFAIAFAQDEEGFSRSVEDDDRSFCWMCDVKVRKVEKSLCSGCLRARYCTSECLSADWGVHGEWCERRRGKREERGERKMELMKKGALRDIEEDNIVD